MQPHDGLAGLTASEGLRLSERGQMAAHFPTTPRSTPQRAARIRRALALGA